MIDIIYNTRIVLSLNLMDPTVIIMNPKSIINVLKEQLIKIDMNTAICQYCLQIQHTYDSPLISVVLEVYDKQVPFIPIEIIPIGYVNKAVNSTVHATDTHSIHLSSVDAVDKNKKMIKYHMIK